MNLNINRRPIRNAFQNIIDTDRIEVAQQQFTKRLKSLLFAIYSWRRQSIWRWLRRFVEALWQCQQRSKFEFGTERAWTSIYQFVSLHRLTVTFPYHQWSFKTLNIILFCNVYIRVSAPIYIMIMQIFVILSALIFGIICLCLTYVASHMGGILQVF